MARFSIIVKGTSQAAVEGHIRNHMLVYVPRTFRAMETDSACLVEGSEIDLMGWFAEDLGREAPFPDGSLLHFSITKVEDRRGEASDRWEER